MATHHHPLLSVYKKTDPSFLPSFKLITSFCFLLLPSSFQGFARRGQGGSGV
jgi:hypothetical protein